MIASTSQLIGELHALGLPDDCPSETEPMRLDSDGIYHMRAICILADISSDVVDVDVAIADTKDKLCTSCAEHLLWEHSPVLTAASRLRSTGDVAALTDVPDDPLAVQAALHQCEVAIAQLKDETDSQVPELITMRENIHPKLLNRVRTLEARISSPEMASALADLCTEALVLAAKLSPRPRTYPAAQGTEVIFGISGYTNATAPNTASWYDEDDEDGATQPQIPETELIDAIVHAFRRASDDTGPLVLAAPAEVYNWLSQFSKNPSRPWSSITVPKRLQIGDNVNELADVVLALWDPDGSGLENFDAAVEAGRACLLAPSAAELRS